MTENRSYHYPPSTWDFRNGGNQFKPDQTHELGHDMEKGKVVPVYARVACSSILSDVVDFNVLSSPRAGSVPILSGPVLSSTSTFKLEKLVQQRDTMMDEYTSNALPSLRKSKRSRSMNLNYQIPLCQVFGCNLNLSFSKEYHKKHKVCEVHSKTARVIVNGLEQRFCQQCSRFHLLAEFDDGKRSCRKRLAGHNLRRRKPQIAHKDGYNFMEMISSPQTSFLCSNILSSRERECGTISKGDFCVKTEPIYNYYPSPVALSQHGNGKQLSKLQASSGGICSEDSEIFSLDHLSCVSAACSQAQPLKTYLGNESLFATQGITSVSDTACALSLLSTQPHNFFIQSPVLNNHRPAHGNSSSLLETFGSSSHSRFSISVAPNRFISSDNSHMNANHLGGLSASEARNTTIKDKICGTTNSLDYMNEKNRMYSADQGTANVGMFHLSSQLHGMSSQRNSIQVKMAKDNFMSCIGL